MHCVIFTAHFCRFAVPKRVILAFIWWRSQCRNNVGYTGNTTGQDNNFVTIPFNAVGYNTSDIQQIKISDGGAAGIGYGTETFSVWEGVPTVAEGSEFFYWDPMYDPTAEATDYYWGDSAGATASFSIAPGQQKWVRKAKKKIIEIKTMKRISVIENQCTRKKMMGQKQKEISNLIWKRC